VAAVRAGAREKRDFWRPGRRRRSSPARRALSAPEPLFVPPTRRFDSLRSLSPHWLAPRASSS
jgi:hypothetical protein